jgi:hypothetical protein
VNGRRVVEHFNGISPAFIAARQGGEQRATAGAANGYAPGNTLAANAPLNNPFSNTAVSATGAGAVNGASTVLANTGSFAVPTGASPAASASTGTSAANTADLLTGPSPASNPVVSSTGGGSYGASSGINSTSANAGSAGNLLGGGSYGGANPDAGFSGMTISG